MVIHVVLVDVLLLYMLNYRVRSLKTILENFDTAGKLSRMMQQVVNKERLQEDEDYAQHELECCGSSSFLDTCFICQKYRVGRRRSQSCSYPLLC